MREIKASRMAGIFVVAISVMMLGTSHDLHQVLGLRGGQKMASAHAIMSQTASEAKPRIVSARLKEKRLMVTGQNFDFGASILVNGERLATVNSGDSPDRLLIARKGGKKIAVGQIINLRVQNSNGQLSDEIAFYSGCG